MACPTLGRCNTSTRSDTTAAVTPTEMAIPISRNTRMERTQYRQSSRSENRLGRPAGEPASLFPRSCTIHPRPDFHRRTIRSMWSYTTRNCSPKILAFIRLSSWIRTMCPSRQYPFLRVRLSCLAGSTSSRRRICPMIRAPCVWSIGRVRCCWRSIIRTKRLGRSRPMAQGIPSS